MKIFLIVFFALMAGVAISMAGCGMGTSKDGGGSSGTAQPEPTKAFSESSGKGSDAGAEKAVQVTAIKQTFDGGEAVAELYDNPTSRDLVSMLPLTLSFKGPNRACHDRT